MCIIAGMCIADVLKNHGDHGECLIYFQSHVMHLHGSTVCCTVVDRYVITYKYTSGVPCDQILIVKEGPI